MAFNQDVKALIPRRDCLGSLLRSAIYAGKERMLSLVVTSAHGTMTLNLSDVRNFKVPLPRVSAESEAIVAVLAAIDSKIDLHSRKRAVLEELFEALLRGLMTGEIRADQLDLAAPSSNRAEVKDAPVPMRERA